jgi:hypothetical protein
MRKGDKKQRLTKGEVSAAIAWWRGLDLKTQIKLRCWYRKQPKNDYLTMSEYCRRYYPSQQRQVEKAGQLCFPFEGVNDG